MPYDVVRAVMNRNVETWHCHVSLFGREYRFLLRITIVFALHI